MTATSCRRRSGKGTKGHGGDTREVGGPKGERMRARGGSRKSELLRGVTSYFGKQLLRVDTGTVPGPVGRPPHTARARGKMALDKLHSAAAATFASCSSHVTRGACVLFREQHLCVWDEPSTTCVDLMRCEDRDASVCETEVTTGETWDHSTNRCFYDTTRKACRWSDECFFQATDDSCSSAGCAWVQSCTPEDFRAQPGPNVCTNVCTVLSASTPPRRVSRTESPVVVEREATTRSPAAPAAGPIVQTTGGAVQGITSGYPHPTVWTRSWACRSPKRPWVICASRRPRPSHGPVLTRPRPTAPLVLRLWAHMRGWRGVVRATPARASGDRGLPRLL